MKIIDNQIDSITSTLNTTNNVVLYKSWNFVRFKWAKKPKALVNLLRMYNLAFEFLIGKSKSINALIEQL